MPWKNAQKHLVHRYARVAALPDQIYRAILGDATGCRSAKDPALTQRDFDVVMARLEGRLDAAIQEGVVRLPGWVRDLWYWRQRLTGPGQMNTRQAHSIRDDLWPKLCALLPEAERTPQYLAGIASKACGRRLDSVWECNAWQAGLVVDALKDRLRWALRHQETAAVA